MEVDATSKPKIAPLLTLPPEVLSIVGNDLCQRSLNALTQTCEALKLVVTPWLYKCLVLRVPVKWSRLSSLESLVSSSDHRFQYVEHIDVATRHSPSRKNDQGTWDHQKVSDGESDPFQIILPAKAASDALNVLVRLLIARLPKHRLQSFRFFSVYSSD